MTDDEAIAILEFVGCKRDGCKVDCVDRCRGVRSDDVEYWRGVGIQIGIPLPALAALATGKAWVAPVELTAEMDASMATEWRDAPPGSVMTTTFYAAARTSSPWGGKHDG